MDSPPGTGVYVLDIETTHLGTHETTNIVEVAIVKVELEATHEESRFTTVYQKLFRPPNPVQPEGYRTHGLST